MTVSKIGLLIVLLLAQKSIVSANSDESAISEGFQLFHWKWDSVQTPYTIAIWLLIASLAKIVFHLMKPLSSVFPDSALLIVVGLAIGTMITSVGSTAILDSHVFFIYLLPPIIFDAGYFMPTRALFANIDSVLLFSCVGTIFNTLTIGGALLFLSYYNLFTMTFSLFEIFVFSALISAVDPVAVIAVFEEVNVNEFLFINVFGEALFNDGVTVVLYQMFKSLTLIGDDDDSNFFDFSVGTAGFFVVVILGGIVIGILFGLLTGFLTKYTYGIGVLAPVFIFLLPYMAYLTCEMISFSSIIAISVCGMVMKQYVKENITQSAASSVKYFTKMLAQSAETLIFMFLGLSTISSNHYVDYWFIGVTIALCLVVRTIGVIVQCLILNRFRKKKFSMIDQFVLSYGGLRGAIAFGLAVSMPDSIEAKRMFVTTTICVIYFTVFLQGTTIRPLVKYLNVETKEDHEKTMAESVYNTYLDYMMSGVEDIAGQKGHYTSIENFQRFNAKVLRPVLLRNETKKEFDASSIVRTYAKITLQDALDITHKQTVKNKQVEKIKSQEARLRKLSENADHPHFQPGEENMEHLYSIFSDLLDRKLTEVQRKGKRLVLDDEIHDDYMKQVHSSMSLQHLNDETKSLPENQPMPSGRRNSNFP